MFSAPKRGACRRSGTAPPPARCARRAGRPPARTAGTRGPAARSAEKVRPRPGVRVDSTHGPSSSRYCTSSSRVASGSVWAGVWKPSSARSVTLTRSAPGHGGQRGLARPAAARPARWSRSTRLSASRTNSSASGPTVPARSSTLPAGAPRANRSRSSAHSCSLATCPLVRPSDRPRGASPVGARRQARRRTPDPARQSSGSRRRPAAQPCARSARPARPPAARCTT